MTNVHDLHNSHGSATGAPEEDADERERVALLELEYAELLDHCAKERRDGEVLLEALHMIYDWSDDFSWVRIDDLTDLRYVLSKRMRAVRAQPNQPPTGEVLDDLMRGTNG